MYLERQNSRPSGVIRGIATERVLVRPPAGRVPTAPPRARLPAGATWLASPTMAAALGGARVLATDKTGNRYCKPVVDAHGDDLRGRLGGDAQDVYPAAGVFDDEERVEPVQGDRVEMEHVAGEGPVGLARRNCTRSDGAGSIPAALRIVHTVEAPIW
jgi:hypothetical protein